MSLQIGSLDCFDWIFILNIIWVRRHKSRVKSKNRGVILTLYAPIRHPLAGFPSGSGLAEIWGAPLSFGYGFSGSGSAILCMHERYDTILFISTWHHEDVFSIYTSIHACTWIWKRFCLYLHARTWIWKRICLYLPACTWIWISICLSTHVCT